jgi:hypothetical protein
MTGAPLRFDVPLYMTPPSTPAIRRHIAAGRLGAIATPAQGNRLQEGWWWCADNGVYGGAYPGDGEYLAWLRRLRPFAGRCLFAAAPDVVGSHPATWRRSYDMLQRIRDLGYPAALVGQDLMEFCGLWDWQDFDVLFLGGSTQWKLSPAGRRVGWHAWEPPTLEQTRQRMQARRADDLARYAAAELAAGRFLSVHCDADGWVDGICGHHPRDARDWLLGLIEPGRPGYDPAWDWRRPGGEAR